MTTQLADIQLLLLDVDGVLTDGSITYTDTGEQIKSFNAKDGLGIRLLMAAGIDVGIVTARVSGALRHRCDNLGITLVFDGIRDKAGALESISESTQISTAHMAFMGDDLIDLPAMIRSGFAVTVADAPAEVKTRADMITDLPGGKGAVRQVCEAILKAKGLWETSVSRFLS
ncbi:MAG: phenylphosphate carboxylase subunit delta [Desulfobacter postgatei]|uniref:Phenylphosphate carboxylase subunit delta n=1 Tax=Desulfobacter postgatei TaxID=2293 RepID=A0A2G6MSD2_9BACT|nr:MAG: phenylphosphate carboxylase subunit delta [Desulfobacter postgatei]